MELIILEKIGKVFKDGRIIMEKPFCSITQDCCDKGLIGDFFRRNRIDRAPFYQGLDRREIQEVLITWFRGFVRIRLVFFRIKLAPHLSPYGNEEHVDPPVVRRQNRLRDIGGGQAGALQ